VTYESLVKLPLVKGYEVAFFQATGVALRLAPAGEPAEGWAACASGNPFCRLVAGVDGMAAACEVCTGQIQRRASETLQPQSSRCFAGLEVVAAPVLVGGQHVATWIGGQVFSRPPNPADFDSLVNRVLPARAHRRLDQIKTAFFAAPVVPATKLKAMRALLALFAQHLGEYAERHFTVPHGHEPKSVRLAKQFLEAHTTEPITLAQVADAAHVSRYHFCRLFRNSTGLRFTEYLSRLRIERAKILLRDPSLRISEIAYGVGFGSISQFNASFRKCVGQSPTTYREGLLEAAEGERPARAAASKIPATNGKDSIDERGSGPLSSPLLEEARP